MCVLLDSVKTPRDGSGMKILADFSDADLLRETGEVLFGAHWQAEIAKKLGVSKSLIRFIAKGERRMSNRHREDMYRMCAGWLLNMLLKKSTIETLAGEWQVRVSIED